MGTAKPLAALRDARVKNSSFEEGSNIVWIVSLNPTKDIDKVRLLNFSLTYGKGTARTDLTNLRFSNGVKLIGRYLEIPISVKAFYCYLGVVNDFDKEGIETITAKFGSKAVTAHIQASDVTPPKVATVKNVEAFNQTVAEGKTIVWTVNLDLKKDILSDRSLPFSLTFGTGANKLDFTKLSFSGGVQRIGNRIYVPKGIARFTVKLTVVNDLLFEADETVTARFGKIANLVTIQKNDLNQKSAVHVILQDLVVSNVVNKPSPLSGMAFRYLMTSGEWALPSVVPVMTHYRSYHYFLRAEVQKELGKIPAFAQIYFNNARLLMALDLTAPSASADVASYIGNVSKLMSETIDRLKVLASSAKVLFQPVNRLLGNNDPVTGMEPFKFGSEIYRAPLVAIAHALNNDNGPSVRPYEVTRADGSSSYLRFDEAFYRSFGEYIKKSERALWKAQEGISEAIQKTESQQKADYINKLVTVFIGLTAFAGVGVNNFIGAPLSFFSDLFGKKLTKNNVLTDKGVGEFMKVSGGASGAAAGTIASADRIARVDATQSAGISAQISGLAGEDIDNVLGSVFLEADEIAHVVQLRKELHDQQSMLVNRVAQLALEIGYTLYQASNGAEAPFHYTKQSHFDIALPNDWYDGGWNDANATADYLISVLPRYGVSERFKSDLEYELKRSGWGDGVYGQHVVQVESKASPWIRGWTVDWFDTGNYMGWRVQEGWVHF